MKDGNKNRLRAQDIHKIVDAFTEQLDVPRYSRMVPLAEIGPKNDFNLNLPRYIDSTEPEDLQDIDAHLRGGIPSATSMHSRALLGGHCPRVRANSFGRGDRPGYAQLQSRAVGGQAGHLRASRNSPASSTRSVTAFRGLAEAQHRAPEGIAVGDKPKALIEEIAEDLLDALREAPLIDTTTSIST